MRRAERSLGVLIAIAALLSVGWQGHPSSRQIFTRAVELDLVAMPPRGHHTTRPRRPKHEALATGKLLVATPQVTGPFFSQSVVLLIDYNAEGAVGLILNQKASLPITELIVGVNGIEKRSDRVFLGGPVSPASIAFLIRGKSKPPESRSLINEVHVSGSRLSLEHVLAKEMPASRFHVYAGYAGWGPGQLDGELERGDWRVAPGEATHIFDDDPDGLWRKLFFRYGGVEVQRRDARANATSG